jgi:hypothetical protein
VANFWQEAEMRELNPIGREGDSLLLVSSDGEQFSVTVDETLKRTIKEHRVPDVSGEQLSPRQIQDAIRAGKSITDISEQSGTSLSLVERFAHPVLEELQHMVDLALSVRIELPADRFNDVEKKPFGDVIEENLVAAGATSFTWSSSRSENSVWLISVSYQLGADQGSATWTFDPRRYLLTPETSNAQSLSTPGSKLDTPIRPATKVSVPEDPARGEAVVTADKLEAFRSRRAKAEAEVEDVVDVVAEEITKSEETIVVIEEDVPLAEVITLTQPIEPIPEDLGEESQEPEIEETPAPKSELPKKSRAPMPSWDQIVRGTQSDDGEAF